MVSPQAPCSYPCFSGNSTLTPIKRTETRKPTQQHSYIHTSGAYPLTYHSNMTKKQTDACLEAVSLFYGDGSNSQIKRNFRIAAYSQPLFSNAAQTVVLLAQTVEDSSATETITLEGREDFLRGLAAKNGLKGSAVEGNIRFGFRKCTYISPTPVSHTPPNPNRRSPAFRVC